MNEMYDRIFMGMDNGICKNDIDNLPLAMAYVPCQKWEHIYDNDVALCRGTIFAKLDLPFLGRRATEK
ncbi:MAG: spore coat associated protein CotJA [Clostridia bacterium]|nr:spore coat associated protein CotJA [Clostridia bacterium]